MKELTNEIRAYALKNAIEFGKTDSSKILPKLFQHGLQKSEIKSVISQINNIVNEVNSMSQKERENEYKKFSKYVIVREEKEKELPELPEISKNMIFRVAPFPSGAIHIGNAKTFLLNAMYAEKYKGKILLVMDDTIGSEEKPISADAYGLIEDSLKWLKIEYRKPVIYKSDRIKLYYEYAEKLIKLGKAYVCHCSAEQFKKYKEQGLECGCRQFPPNIQIKRWKEMFRAKQGDAVLRIKTSMMHPNPAFRDRVLFRIADREHPRVKKKYRVWPTLEMSWAVDDHELGITHIIRGNDLMIETDMEKFLWDIFKWKHPVTIHTGLVRIEGVEAKISKSKAQKEVKSGKFIGWDDPRTWSIQSLRRRGFLPESLREFVKEIGLNKQDIVVPIDSFYAINRKIIDSTSFRYSFIEDPIELEIQNAPDIDKVDIPIHPDKPKEKRVVRVTPGKIFISKRDYDSFKGKEIRLLHLYNIKLNGKEATFTSLENRDIPKITWVSFPEKAKILMPNGKWTEGIADEQIFSLKEGDVIQFERNFFCRFDRKNKDIYEFWYAHN